GQVALHLHHEAKLARDTTRLRVARDSALAAAFLLARSVDSLHRAPLTAAVRRIGEACGEQIYDCEQRRAQLSLALESEHAKVNLISERLAGADTLLTARAVDTKHMHVAFLTITKPRKTVAAAIGCFLGALVDHGDPGVG